MEGTVLELWRWPVKGMAGERMPSLRVDPRGVGGDRAHAVLGEAADGWAPLTGAEAPALEAWRAAYPFNVGANVDPGSPPLPIVSSPRGRSFRWGDPRLRWALEDELGRPVRLHRDVEGIQDVPRTLVVAGAGAPAELRANVRVGLDLAECAPGAVLTSAGGVRLRVLQAGPAGSLHARPLARGRIAAGERLSLSPA